MDYKLNHMSAKIIISRKSEFLNRTRAFKVFIDDNEVGAVSNGSAEEFSVEAGKHSVYVKIGWYKSIVFDATVSEGENKYLLTHSGMTLFWPLYIVMLAGLILNIVLRKEGIDLNGVADVLRYLLIIPPILYYVYFMTLGRNKYVLLREDKNNVFNS